MSSEIEIVNRIEDITDEELQGLYMYLAIYFEQMTNEEKASWIEIMKKIDKDYHDID